MKIEHLFIFIGLTAIVGIMWLASATKMQHDINDLKSVIKEKEEKITYWQNKKGQTVSEKPAAQVTKKEFKDNYPELMSIIKDMNIKVSRLQAIVSTRIEATDSGTVRIDTVRIEDQAENNIRIDDGYLKAGIKWTDPKQVHWNYSYVDSLTFAFYLKKKWFLGKEELYGSGMLSNKNAKVTNQTAVKIEKYKDKRFIIGAGVSYDPISGQVHPTAGIYYALFKF